MVQRKRIDWLTSNRQLEPFAASDFFEIVFLFVFGIEVFFVCPCVFVFGLVDSLLTGETTSFGPHSG